MLAFASVVAALVAAAAPAASPWEAPAFTARPADVAAAAAKLDAPRKTELDLLLEEGVFSFDEAGRVTYTYRLVYRPLTKAAAEGWAEIGRAWSPWHEERPSVRGRVVHRDGTEHVLDPGTLSEGAVDDGREPLYSDRRVLRGPLPAAGPDTVVEEETSVRETAPLFDRGSVHRFWIGREAPVRRIRLVVSAPASLPLRFALRGGLSLAPRERREGARRILEWSFADVARRKTLEPDLTPADAVQPHVVFGTGASWAAVAARYAASADRQLEGSDLAARAKEIAGGATDRVVVAQRLLDWISARVRYTGLELGEASIVPAPPAATLDRRYGDCKDLSLLLTGLLRALGHPAELALVRTGADDAADLPGLGEFDHAIVHVGGAPELWIDATDPATPVGELPTAVQGKLALVAAPRTVGLVRTPELPAAGNRVEIDREIVLAETGRARVSEVRLLRGGLAAAERRSHRRDLAAEARRKADEAEAAALFADGKLVSATREGLDDLRAPVRVRLEGTDSRWGVTGEDDAEAVVAPTLVFATLPAHLRPEPPTKEDGEAPPARDEGDADEGETAAGNEPRTRDLLLPRAYVTELRYRVVPPPGFRADALPDAKKVQVGPARYERTFAVGPDGAVTALHRFEVTRRRLTAAEAEALRSGLASLAEDGPRVRFQRVSEVLLGEGKGREALDELRRLIALHPTEALHQNRLALGLLRLGMGEAARKAAHRAVELEPGSGWARRVLATVLGHDLLGRWLEPGCDLEGAVAAQRKAVELEKEPFTRARLAFFLEHGGKCERWGAGARLDEAIQVFRSIRDELKSKAHDTELLEVYLHAGRFEDARSLAGDMKDGPERRAALIAATAALEGGPAAARAAARFSADDRGTALQGALMPLLAARRYAAAADLLDVAAAGTAASAQLRARAAMLRRVRPSESFSLDPDDPATLFPRLMRDLLLGADPARMEAYVTAGGDSAKDVAAGFRAGLQQGLRKQRNDVGLPTAAAIDLTLSLLETRKDGDDEAGYRLRLVVPGVADPLTVHAVRDRGRWRLVTSTPEFAGLAGYARRLAEAGKPVPARRVLGFVRDAASRAGEGSPGAVLATLWTRGDAAGSEELATAGRAVEAFGDGAVELSRLEQARAREADPERRRALGWALAAGYRSAKRWEDVLATTRELEREGVAETVFALQAAALVQLGRRDALRALVERRQAASPEGGAEAQRFLSQAAIRAGDADEACRVGTQIVDAGRAGAMDYNNLAWASLFRAGPLAPGALEQARRSVALSGERDAASLHTLAAVYAEAGDAAEAIQVLAKSIEQRGGGEPEPYDWLVVGRVAEHYGLVDQAAAAYGRVKGQDDGGLSAHLLAERWRGRMVPN